MINRRPAVTSMRMTADDVWAAVLVLPLLTLAFGLVCFGTKLFYSPGHFVKGYLPTFLLVASFHTALVQVSYAMRRRFPSHNDTAKRLSSALALYLITSYLAIHFSLWLYDSIDLLGTIKTTALTNRCMAVAVVGNLVNGVMYDGFYTFAKMREALVAKEGLQKEHLRQQFDALKTQVNPHFLFNNLNTLSELIEEDADAADRFLNEMSKVYRYMLRSRSHTWAPVQQELHCLRSYFYLLSVRYGPMVVFENTINENHEAWQLPSFSLPLIVEEAVRSSRFSKQEPLLIRMASYRDCLEISYPARPKLRVIDTEGLNWHFLTDRFTEQNLQGFSRTETGDRVRILLPLLEPQQTLQAV